VQIIRASTHQKRMRDARSRCPSYEHDMADG